MSNIDLLASQHALGQQAGSPPGSSPCGFTPVGCLYNKKCWLTHSPWLEGWGMNVGTLPAAFHFLLVPHDLYFLLLAMNLMLPRPISRST